MAYHLWIESLSLDDVAVPVSVGIPNDRCVKDGGHSKTRRNDPGQGWINVSKAAGGGFLGFSAAPRLSLLPNVLNAVACQEVEAHEDEGKREKEEEAAVKVLKGQAEVPGKVPGAGNDFRVENEWHAEAHHQNVSQGLVNHQVVARVVPHPIGGEQAAEGGDEKEKVGQNGDPSRAGKQGDPQDLIVARDLVVEATIVGL